MLSQREAVELLAMADDAKRFIAIAKLSLRTVAKSEDDEALKKFQRGLANSLNRIDRCSTILKRELDLVQKLAGIKSVQKASANFSAWRDSGRQTQPTSRRKLERREAQEKNDRERNT